MENLCNENGYYRAKIGTKLVNYASEFGGRLNLAVLKLTLVPVVPSKVNFLGVEAVLAIAIVDKVPWFKLALRSYHVFPFPLPG